jgi:hypothetical protein
MKRSILAVACATLAIGLAACGADGNPSITSSGPSAGSPAAHVPTSIVAVTTAQQSARPGTPVAQPPTVEVRDEKGTAMPNVSVTFTTNGGGSVATTQVVTNSKGQASAGAWTVGNVVGPYFVTAAVGGGTLSVEFTAFALVPGKAGRLDLVAVDGKPLPLREQVDFEVFDLIGGRFRLADDGTFSWGYIWRDIVNGVAQPADSLIDFQGGYVQRDSATIDFYFFASGANLHGIQWRGIGTVRGDSVKVRYVVPNGSKQDETYVRR